MYPEYATADVWLAGESYSGHYVPQARSCQHNVAAVSTAQACFDTAWCVVRVFRRGRDAVPAQCRWPAPDTAV
jgi:hypothetical protein